MMIKILKDKHKTVSIVGMAKNVGKTVTLNELINQGLYHSVALGITSIGRDGEEKDLVSNTEKPRIFVHCGTIITTAEKLLKKSSIKYEILYVMKNTTVLGRILIIRVLRNGYVDISGPANNKEISLASEIMHSYGADLVIIDGAIDRTSSASPAIAEAAVLSTGAAVSRNLSSLINETVYKTKLLSLEQIEDGNLRKKVYNILFDNKIAVINEQGLIEIINVKAAIGSAKKIATYIKENSILVIPGALTEMFLKNFSSYIGRKKIKIVVRDGTRIFVKSDRWLFYESIGIDIKVFDSIDIIAITVNPYSPKGYFFESKLIIDGLKKYIVDIPIIDVLKEEGYGY
ncbi:lysine 5,6-aminomutase reactivase subunit KamB [Helicovermis profundi]|uniref:Uncharacterized protein n=1 Tax=Helicovermis profundi TaxID=3065157 RepID=A0AAU9ERS6_9FIRM|nr:hypothetical protein HLPR_00860 [Clostridia bacterium S502]